MSNKNDMDDIIHTYVHHLDGQQIPYRFLLDIY